jgi:putative redox protein
MDVVVSSGSGMEQQIQVGRHHLVSDEPVAYGGADEGPSPYELLAAAVGSCTSMTLRMYARAKGWPLQRVVVTIRHDKIYARDCAECETREGRIDRLEREIALEGPLEEGQKQRLLEIAERCPVHRTLSREVQLLTRLKAP